MDDMNDRIDIAKEKISELEGIAVETVQNETFLEKQIPI